MCPIIKDRPLKMCRCGKKSFFSLQDALTQVDKELSLGRVKFVYECNIARGIFHLTTKHSASAEKLLLGMLDRYHLVVIKTPDGNRWLLANPHNKIVRNIRAVVADMSWAEGIKMRDVDKLYPIAMKTLMGDWISYSTYVSIELNNQPLDFIVISASESIRTYNMTAPDQNKLIQKMYTRLNEGFKYCSDEGIVDKLLSVEEVIKPVVEVVVPIVLTPKKEKVRTERKEKKVNKYITMDKNGLEQWEMLDSTLKVFNISISDMVIQLITEENKRRS